MTEGATQAPEVQTHVEIMGDQVPISDIALLCDRDCRHRCVDGVLTVGRPLPKPFRGIHRQREVCACVVRSHAARRARNAPPVVSPETEAAALAPASDQAAALRPERPSHALRQATNLRGALEAAAHRKAEILQRRAARIAPLRVEASDVELERQRWQKREVDAKAVENQLVARRAEVEEELRELRRRIDQALSEQEQARAQVAALDGQAAGVLSDIARAEAADAKELARAEREVEKLGRRLRTCIAYHPEAAAIVADLVSDAGPAQRQAEGDAGSVSP